MRFPLQLVLALLIVSSGYSQFIGPNNPNSVIDGGGGRLSESWLNANNARTQNNVYASAILGNNRRTNFLEASHFGFNIPTGSSILGILVEVDRFATAPGGRVNDKKILIIDATGEIGAGDDQSAGAVWPTSDTDAYESYGGPTNTWGLSDWTPAKINSDNFGVAIQAESSINRTTYSLFVDQIRMTVFYITGGAQRYAVATGNWSSSSSWSLTPGGTPGASPPADVNDVFIGGGHTITYDQNGITCNSLTIGTTESTRTGNLAFAGNNSNLTVYTGGLEITADGNVVGTRAPIVTVAGDLRLNAVLTNRDFVIRMDGGDSSKAIINGTGTLGKLAVESFTTHIGNITVTRKISGGTLNLINGHTGHLTYSGRTANMDTNVLDLLPIDNIMEFSQTTLDAPDFNIQKPSVLFYNLIISGNAPKYYNLNISVLGNLTISPGAVLTNQGQRSITLSGNWTNNNGADGFDPGACNACKVIFSGDNAQTITNAAGEQFYNVEVAKGSATTLTAANNIVIDNQLLMTSGNFDVGSNSLTGTASTIFNDGDLFIGTIGSTVPELTGTYDINGGTFTFNGAGDQTIRSSTSTPAITPYNTLRFAGSGTKSLSGSINVASSISIIESAILDVTTANFAIFLSGDWTNASTFLSQSGTVTFEGLATQFITNPAGATYYNLTINNSAISSAIVLNSPVVVNGLLTFTDGHIISSSSALLTLGAGAAPTGAKDQSHVKGPVAKVISSTAAFAFPIGDGSNYMPASVTPTSATGTSFIAEYNSSEQSVGTTTSGVDHVSSQDYWTIQRVSGTDNAAVTLVWEYPSAAESEINVLNDLLVAQWNGTDWTGQGNAGTTGNFIAGSVTSNAISSFTQPYFVIGSSTIFNPLSNYRYFAATTGNWNDTNVWAYRPLGPTTAPEPTSTKQVVILPGNTVTVQDSPAGQSLKSMKSLRVFGTMVFSDAVDQDITLEVDEGGMTLEAAADITGTDAGDEIRMGGDIRLNNTSSLSHQVLETNFVTPGHTISGKGGSLPILRINQNKQIFTDSTSYDSLLAIASNATNNGKITISKSLTGGGILTNGATGTIVWDGTSAGSQIIDATTPGNTIHLKSAAFGSPASDPFAVINGGTVWFLILDGSQTYRQNGGLKILADLIILPGSVLDNAYRNGTLDIGGNWINNNGTAGAGFLCGTGKITFNGSNPQTIFTSAGNEVFKNLVINNTSSTGITLTRGEVHVASNLTLTDGMMFTDATNLLVLEDNAKSDVGHATSFVDGPMKKIGNEAFVFPVGDAATWARLGLENIAGFDVTTEFTCQYLRAPYADRTSLDSHVAGVSSVEHWLLTRGIDPGNNASCKVRLFWESEAASHIVDKADLRVGHYYTGAGGLKWYNFGSVVKDNGNSSGSVLSTTTFTSYGPVTFASEFGFALPIGLTSFTAHADGNASVDLYWTTATEVQNDYFTVQRSVNGVDFESLFKVEGAGNSTTTKSYHAVDPDPYGGVSYYRLQQTDYDGKSSYSHIAAVSLPEYDWSVYPNPSNGSTIQIHVPRQYANKSLLVSVVDSRGITIRRLEVLTNAQGTIDLSPGEQLTGGVYLVSVTDGYIRYVMRLVVAK